MSYLRLKHPTPYYYSIYDYQENYLGRVFLPERDADYWCMTSIIHEGILRFDTAEQAIVDIQIRWVDKYRMYLNINKKEWPIWDL